MLVRAQALGMIVSVVVNVRVGVSVTAAPFFICVRNIHLVVKLAMSNVLTAGQIPTACEVVRAIDSTITPPCGKSPIVATVEGRLTHSDNRVLVRWYVCQTCAVEHSGGRGLWVISLAEYEVEEANGIYKH